MTLVTELKPQKMKIEDALWERFCEERRILPYTSSFEDTKLLNHVLARSKVTFVDFTFIEEALKLLKEYKLPASQLKNIVAKLEKAGRAQIVNIASQDYIGFKLFKEVNENFQARIQKQVKQKTRELLSEVLNLQNQTIADGIQSDLQMQELETKRRQLSNELRVLLGEESQLKAALKTARRNFSYEKMRPLEKELEINYYPRYGVARELSLEDERKYKKLQKQLDSFWQQRDDLSGPYFRPIKKRQTLLLSRRQSNKKALSEVKRAQKQRRREITQAITGPLITMASNSRVMNF